VAALGDWFDDADRFDRTIWTNTVVRGFIVFPASRSLHLVGDAQWDGHDPRQRLADRLRNLEEDEWIRPMKQN
jgi:hypothetical protein